MSADMETIPPRLNNVERQLHTHEHRITELEKVPSRIYDLEASMKAVGVTLHHIQESANKQEAALEKMVTSQQIAAKAQSDHASEIAGFVKAGKWIGWIIGILTLANIASSFITQ